jgi:hypothetical protein
VLRQGPISLFLHGVIEYLAGVLLIAAPFLFNFHAGAAKAVSIVAGVVVIVIASSTAGRTSLVDSLPLPVHILLDYALALALIASPFLFGFSHEGPPTAFFLILGVAHLLVTIGTRFRTGADQHGTGADQHG